MKFTQIGWATLIIIGLVLVVIRVVAPPEVSPLHPAASVLRGIIFLLVLIFSWLTTEVTDNAVRIRFGIGVIRREWPLGAIATHLTAVS